MSLFYFANIRQKPPSDKFPNIIGYAPTKQIMAMYGNPHTPLLPHFPSNMWSNYINGTTMRCSGCNNIISDTNPQSPRKSFDCRGSFGNLNLADRNISLSKQRLNSCASKMATPRSTVAGQNIASNYDTPKSPQMVSSPGNLNQNLIVPLRIKMFAL